LENLRGVLCVAKKKGKTVGYTKKSRKVKVGKNVYYYPKRKKRGKK